jgi:L-alanine-DL-glutamate epimerase-like enolase superfamily enzyme
MRRAGWSRTPCSRPSSSRCGTSRRRRRASRSTRSWAARCAIPCRSTPNINRGAERTPAGFAAAAQRAREAGLAAFKLALFDPIMWEAGANPAAYAQGLARVGAVRSAIGPAAELMVDAHWRFSPGSAARPVADLAGYALHWLECPIAEAKHGEIRRLRGLANARGMRLAGAQTPAGLGAYRAILDRAATMCGCPTSSIAADMRSCAASPPSR